MAQKTEKPTEKKRRDAAKKGQSFKSKDFITSIVISVALFFLNYKFTLNPFIQFYLGILSDANFFNIDPMTFFTKLLCVLGEILLPLLLIVSFVGSFVSLIQTRFVIASETLKPNFGLLNPAQGFKRLFTVKTVKDLIKSICYLVVLLFTCYFFVHNVFFKYVLSGANTDLITMTHIWATVTEKIIFIFLMLSLVVLVANMLAEFFIHYKELKMERHEVRQEFKENEGNPEIKNTRKRIHRDILSGSEKIAIRNSGVIMANPTHIAIGIYFNPDVAIFPFITLRCSNVKAKAAIAYAEKIGIPVVRNKKIARKLYKSYTQYSFISARDEVLIAVMDILIWLKQVESIELCQENESPYVSERERSNMDI
ncbi:EscU/YscU/HrcU family type III secretion system export apparatus switch protein [Salmonella enterica]|nr:EscU/YscU/HrcU family type III secretion system export apparatus switch protein [Salmonella enterica]